MSEDSYDTGKSSGYRDCLVLQSRLEAIVNGRIEPFNLELIALLPASCISLRLIKSEQGFKAFFPLGAMSDACNCRTLHDELLLAVTALESAAREIPAPCLLEKMALQCRKLIRSTVSSELPLLQVQRLLKLLCSFHHVISHKVRKTRQYHHARLEALSYFLQEPQSKTAKVLLHHQFYLYWNYARRLRHLNQAAISKLQSGYIVWPARADYLAMNRESKDSRVLVTIHMGDFLGAFKCIADALQEPRPVISLRREGEADAIKNLSQRHAQDHQVFMHGKENPVHIVKALRAGGHTLSVMFDLGSDFGETTKVMFFGHHARFVRGPAVLAILGRARIYPFVCYSEAGRDFISMESAFSPELRVDETLQDAVGRVTQTLVTMAEQWIRLHPAQWKYLDRLTSYLIPDKKVADSHA